jgi:hypothetical protein
MPVPSVRRRRTSLNECGPSLAESLMHRGQKPWTLPSPAATPSTVSLWTMPSGVWTLPSGVWTLPAMCIFVLEQNQSISEVIPWTLPSHSNTNLQISLPSLTTPLIFLHPRSCADSHRFPTR